MSHTRVLSGCLAVAVLVGLADANVAAQRERPVPDAVVKAADGSEASLTSYGSQGQWLVVYVGGPDSAASARLLDAMTTWELGDALTRVVAVAATPDAAPLARLWAEKLPGIRWVADAKGDVAKALKLRGAPSLIGAKTSGVEWVLAGVLNDPTMLRDVIRSWIAVQP